MRPAPTLLCLALMGCISLPTAAQVVTLQVSDISAPGSPIHISGSLIVAQSIETSPRCASAHSQRCGPLLAPGATEPLHVSNGVAITALGSDDQPFAPATEARVVFVQFADGSILGDQKAGEELLLMRQESLESLAHLDDIYSREGEEAFDKAARQPGAGGVLGIAQFEEQDGPAATIARIRRILATAKERLAAMSSQPGR